MAIQRRSLVKNAIWVIGGFGVSQILRLVSGVILARLLAPEVFGIMVIVYSIRTGIDLLSDIGVGQSVVANRDADRPEFYNTAWSLRFLRGFVLFALCAVVAAPLAKFYQAPVLGSVVPVVGAYFAIIGMGSLAPMFLQKRLRSATLSMFELSVEFITSAFQIIFAWFNPTIWVFVLGGMINVMARAIGSYIVVPDIRHRFSISGSVARQIFSFGFWIFLSSLIYFLSANFDRLYLGRVIPFGILGIYGIARSLAEIANTLASRLNFIIIFPFIASQAETSRRELRFRIRSSRAMFLLIAAVSLAAIALVSDLLINILYDRRYHEAGGMLSALTIGVWFSIVCTINESTLLGLGKPHYAAIANGLKLVWLVAGIATAVPTFGIVGVVIVVLLSDAWRYIPIFIGQRREHLSFGSQDVIITMAFLALIVVGEWARWFLGFGTSFSGLWG